MPAAPRPRPRPRPRPPRSADGPRPGGPGRRPRASAAADRRQAAGPLAAPAAREQIGLGHYDERRPRSPRPTPLNVKWGLFDDTPAKVREAIDKARPKLAAAASPAPSAGTRDRREAKARLKEGRDRACAAGQFEQAEAIALEVNPGT